MAHGENAPLNITPGAIRFNTDSMKLEYFRIGMEGGSTSSYAGIGTMAAGEWVQLTTTSPEVQTGGTRAIVFTGYTGSRVDAIEFFNIDTTGNGTDFGNLTVDRSGLAAAGSRVRGLCAAGMGPNASPADKNVIDFVTIASTGNATDFGDRTTSQRDGFGLSNEIRACFGGGQAGGNDTIDYVTIAQTGNAVDFGNLTSGRGGISGSCASSTRGIAAGGAGLTNAIDFITISTQGNAADFGDLIATTQNMSGSSNAIRGTFAGGDTPGQTNRIDYVEIATLGNAQNFGDLLSIVSTPMGTSSSTRSVVCGGYISSASNVIQYYQIMSKGNAVDFGDLNVAGWTGDATSNGHGGLG